MPASLSQFFAVVGMSLAGLPSRFAASIVTILSVALTVLTLFAFLAMAAGFSRTVAGAGSDTVAIVTGAGAQAEATSRIPAEAVRVLSEAPGIARGGDGQAIVSPEALVVVEAARVADGSLANVSLRGVTPAAAGVRPGFVLTEGRMFQPGSNELIVGASLLDTFAGLRPGDDYRLGQTTWKVVGVFDVGDSVFDSEIWGDLASVQGVFQRAEGVQAMRLQLVSPGALSDLKAFVAADPRLRVDVTSEREYLAAQSDKLQLLIGFGWVLAMLLGVGALAGALNTMYATVEARAKENATLRAIGFGRWTVFAGTMAESVALAVAGALLAGAVALALLNGLQTSTLGEGFTQVVFRLSVGPAELVAGLLVALGLGLAGGLLPALRAATAPVLKLGD